MMELMELLCGNKVIYFTILSFFSFFFILLLFALGACYKKSDCKIEVKKEEVKPQPTEDQLKAKLELQKVLEQMGEDLEKKPKEAVYSFEKEQEENAIISYQELLKSVKEDIKEGQEVLVQDEKIELNDVTYDIEDDIAIKSINIDEKKFKNTTFISPVYGVLDKKVEQEKEVKPIFQREIKPSEIIMEDFEQDIFKETLIELEDTLKMKPVSEELKKNDEFLSALKEFRKNL